MPNSTRRRRPRHHQSAKPYPDFPLTAHPTGRWCKKVRGRVVFFGKIDDWQAALDKWLQDRDDLFAGRVPREQMPVGITLRDVANAYLRHKKELLENNELSTRTFADSFRTCDSLIEHFGKHRLLDDIRREDFATYRVKSRPFLGPLYARNDDGSGNWGEHRKDGKHRLRASSSGGVIEYLLDRNSFWISVKPILRKPTHYYDPKQMGFRSLRVINDDRVAPGAGFGMHGHREMEIVSYVLSGSLAHRDSVGSGAELKRGDVQRMSAGTGIRHSEYNGSKQNPVHFLQIWVVPERTGLSPVTKRSTLATKKSVVAFGSSRLMMAGREH